MQASIVRNEQKQATTPPSSGSVDGIDVRAHVPRKPRGTPVGVPQRQRSSPRKSSATFPEFIPFGQRLETIRRERRLTQRVLAARASISGNHYQEIVAACANPTLAVVIRLAEVLDVSLSDLLDPVGKTRDEQRRNALSARLKALVEAHSQFLDGVRIALEDIPPADVGKSLRATGGMSIGIGSGEEPACVLEDHDEGT